MCNIEKESYMKYLMVAFFLLILYLAFIVIRPFIISILSAFIIAYIFHPVYHWINDKINKKGLSSITTIIIIIFLIALPMTFIINSLIGEAFTTYNNIKEKVDSGQLSSSSCEKGGIICNVLEFFGISDTNFKAYINDLAGDVTSSIVNKASGFFILLPSKLMSIFVILFVTFYLLIDGESFVRKAWTSIPIKVDHKHSIVNKTNDIISAIIFGYIVVALIQGFLAGVGYFLFGIPSPIMWGMITAFAALIPLFGSAIIWFPASVYLLIQGISISNSWMVWMGIGLFLYCLLIVGSVDNILRPKIIGKKAKIHPVIIFLGVIGGLVVFGMTGIIIGPLILALLVTFLEIYQEEKK